LTEKGYYEEVSDLNGIAIPNMYFDKIKDVSESTSKDSENSENNSEPEHYLYSMIDDLLKNTKENEFVFLKNKFKKASKKCKTNFDYLYLSNLYVATCDKLYFKLNQIQEHEYTWLTDEMRDKCFSRIDDILGEECKRHIKIESPIGYASYDKENDNIIIQNKINRYLEAYFPNEEFQFYGRLDLLTEDTIWELKCTNDTENEHFLQLVIYAWLWRVTMEDIEHLQNIKNFKLFNIKTGEVFLLHSTMDELTYIVIALLKNKYGEKEVKPDVDFIEECDKYLTRV